MEPEDFYWGLKTTNKQLFMNVCIAKLPDNTVWGVFVFERAKQHVFNSITEDINLSDYEFTFVYLSIIKGSVKKPWKKALIKF